MCREKRPNFIDRRTKELEKPDMFIDYSRYVKNHYYTPIFMSL